MTVGMQVLRAVCELQARTAFRHLNRELFVDREVLTFDFVENYYRRYDQLPALGVLEAEGFRLPAAPGAVQYHLDQLRKRCAYTAMMTRHQDFLDATQERDIEGALAVLDEMRLAAASVRQIETVQPLGEAAREVIADWQQAALHPGLQGVTLGWDFLDEHTGGLQAGDIATIVARPGVGKSWCLLWMALQAWQRGASVLVASLEMQAKQMARRLIGLASGINPDFIRRGQVSTYAQPRMIETVEALEAGAPFHLTIGGLSQSVRDVDVLIQELAPDVVYVDASYLLRPTSDGLYRGKRFEMLSEVGEGLKQVAQLRRRPIVQTVQFNRASTQEKGGGGLAHIGGSDTVGQISSIVIALKPGNGAREATSRRTELVKNRDGVSDRTHFINFRFTPLDLSHAEDLDAEWLRQTEAAGLGDSSGRPGGIGADSPGIQGMTI